ncbi:MAG: biopolymer transporter ExbD [Sedimentisphaerales bacterium]|nr:biopolymer transporter ExbD [Sedimentisphaerales bacterium]MBN2843673.1 biopolymer transporter ExbD [Sedimentisphaerales bacterium]
MTPMIDVIFLLIVFFMLICQFISQDMELLSVPDNCLTASNEQIDSNNEIEIRVYSASDNDAIIYAIAQQEFSLNSPGVNGQPEELISGLAQKLKELAPGLTDPVIRLRGDGRLLCDQVRPAIKAAALAGLANVRFAAFKEQQMKQSAEGLD